MMLLPRAISATVVIAATMSRIASTVHYMTNFIIDKKIKIHQQIIPLSYMKIRVNFYLILANQTVKINILLLLLLLILNLLVFINWLLIKYNPPYANIIISKMIVQTIRKSQIIEEQTIYKPTQNLQNSFLTANTDQSFNHAKPILALPQNSVEKRLPHYNITEDQSTKLQTKSDFDMSRSNLARMNEELEGRTNYYTRLGKYDSKYAQERVENFGTGSRLSQPEMPRVRRNSDYLRSPHQREQTYFRPITQENEKLFTPNYRMTSPQQYRESPVHFRENPRSYNMEYNTYHDEPTFNRKLNDSDDHKFYDLSDPADQMRYHAHEAKEAAKGTASEVKEQVKSNVRQNVKDAVGTDNYYLMKNIKDATGELASKAGQNLKQNVKDVAYGVAGTAIAAGEVVADGARAVKNQVKENTKEAVVAAVGPQNFNIMKYITDAIGQLKSNILGTTPSKPKETEKVTAPGKYPAIQQKMNFPPVMKADSLNEVSPIQYSQRSFSQGPAEQFGFFWIYGLIAVGFFLVIFQVLK